MWFEWVANEHEKMPAIKDPDVIKYMMNSIIETGSTVALTIHGVTDSVALKMTIDPDRAL